MTGAPQIRRPEAPAPAVAAIGRRLLDRIDDLTTELTELIRQAEPFYGASGVAEPTGVAELHLALEAARIRRSSS
jgi:hypothetical protein